MKNNTWTKLKTTAKVTALAGVLLAESFLLGGCVMTRGPSIIPKEAFKIPGKGIYKCVPLEDKSLPDYFFNSTMYESKDLIDWKTYKFLGITFDDLGSERNIQLFYKKDKDLYFDYENTPDLKELSELEDFNRNPYACSITKKF